MKLSRACEILRLGGVDEPMHDARELFMQIGGISRHELMLSDAECDVPELLRAVERRAAREPLQYIIGEVCFYKETYLVNENCLIPRSDTEILVDYAVKNLPHGAHFLDLCTGSGCVGISTLCNTKDTTACLADISEGALGLARRNAERNGVLKRAEFRLCDVLSQRIPGNLFAVLANPPYVTGEAYEALAPEISYEPRIAFLGGADGMDFYRRLTLLYRDAIPSEGFIAYEIGYDQGEKIAEVARNNKMSCELIRDLSGNDRVAVLRVMH